MAKIKSATAEGQQPNSLGVVHEIWSSNYLMSWKLMLLKETRLTTTFDVENLENSGLN